MTWEDAIESYKTYLILEKSLSSNSVEAYLNDIKKLAKYCAANITLQRLMRYPTTI